MTVSDNTMNLIHGDSYDIISTLPDNSIDLVITDPPYEIGVKGRGIYCKRNFLNNLEDLDSTHFDVSTFMELIVPKMRMFNGYFFCNKFLLPEYLNYAVEHKMKFDVFTLHKSNPIPSWGGHHLNDTEYCVLMHESGTYFDRGLDIDDYRKSCTVRCQKGLHPAEKPVEFLERFVRVSCPEGGLVLDPFMGSGSTGIACLKNGRNFLGIEKDEAYYKVASERIYDYTGKGNLFGGNYF